MVLSPHLLSEIFGRFDCTWVDIFSITALGAEQNFYFDNDGNLVIVYSKYEVAPGYMGCPEIVIDKDDFEKYLILNFEPGQ